MTFKYLSAAFIGLCIVMTTGCGDFAIGGDQSSRGPAKPEPDYYGEPTPVADPITVTVATKFLYRTMNYVSGATSGNGLLKNIDPDGLPIPFAEFHIYDSQDQRIQQGETDTNGLAVFQLPKTAGTYTLKVFSRADNEYLKVRVLADNYSNEPYFISKVFTLSESDIQGSSLDLSSSPMIAQADEALSAKIEGGAFNIMYNILLANEYIRRQIGKNGDADDGVPSSDPNKWWVADKVIAYWKMGFNPYSVYNSEALLSYYIGGSGTLYVLGGNNGDVKFSDTDHFDDSVILHEYAHFLEDKYSNAQSPGGSHNGNFVIDPRLAWSEGFANYFQAAVLSGTALYNNSQPEDRIPASSNHHYYLDSYGYLDPNVGSGGMGIAFNLSQLGATASYDSTSGARAGQGTFMEVSVARTLYKSTRATTVNYSAGKPGGGISFADVWRVFGGEDNAGHSRTSPLLKSFRRWDIYPIPNAGLFNFLLTNYTTTSEWEDVLAEEAQRKSTVDYAYRVQTSASGCPVTFNGATQEKKMYSFDDFPRSNQEMNNDFYLYYHNATETEIISLDYSSTENQNLDLIVYYGGYLYVEDGSWSNRSYIAGYSRSSTAGTAETVSMAGLPSGFYIINVKVNALKKTQAQLQGTATYQLKKDSTNLCGTEN